MSKHRPGPWVIRRNTKGYPYQIEDLDGKGITVWAGLSAPVGEYAEGNANLISAAPDMLSALVISLECMERSLEYYDPALDAARAAIRKALGEEK